MNILRISAEILPSVQSGSILSLVRNGKFCEVDEILNFIKLYQSGEDGCYKKLQANNHVWCRYGDISITMSFQNIPLLISMILNQEGFSGCAELDNEKWKSQASKLEIELYYKWYNKTVDIFTGVYSNISSLQSASNIISRNFISSFAPYDMKATGTLDQWNKIIDGFENYIESDPKQPIQSELRRFMIEFVQLIKFLTVPKDRDYCYDKLSIAENVEKPLKQGEFSYKAYRINSICQLAPTLRFDTNNARFIFMNEDAFLAPLLFKTIDTAILDEFFADVKKLLEFFPQALNVNVYQVGVCGIVEGPKNESGQPVFIQIKLPPADKKK